MSVNIIHPPPNDRIEADQTPICVLIDSYIWPHCCPFLSNNCLDALSATLVLLHVVDGSLPLLSLNAQMAKICG